VAILLKFDSSITGNKLFPQNILAQWVPIANSPENSGVKFKGIDGPKGKMILNGSG